MSNSREKLHGDAFVFDFSLFQPCFYFSFPITCKMTKTQRTAPGSCFGANFLHMAKLRKRDAGKVCGTARSKEHPGGMPPTPRQTRASMKSKEHESSKDLEDGATEVAREQEGRSAP